MLRAAPEKLAKNELADIPTRCIVTGAAEIVARPGQSPSTGARKAGTVAILKERVAGRVRLHGRARMALCWQGASGSATWPLYALCSV